MCEGLKPRAGHTQGCPGRLPAREDGALASRHPAQGVLAPVTRPSPLTRPEGQNRLCQETCGAHGFLLPISTPPERGPQGPGCLDSPGTLLADARRGLSVRPAPSDAADLALLSDLTPLPAAESDRDASVFPPARRGHVWALPGRSSVPSERDPQLTVTFSSLGWKGCGHGGGRSACSALTGAPDTPSLAPSCVPAPACKEGALAAASPCAWAPAQPKAWPAAGMAEMPGFGVRHRTAGVGEGAQGQMRDVSSRSPVHSPCSLPSPLGQWSL